MSFSIPAPRISVARPSPAQSLAWPFRVNWQAGATEQIAFRTDIVTSRTGREQRRAIRPLPRYSYEWSTWAKGDRFRQLAARSYAKGGRSLVLPHPTDRVRLSSLAAAAGNSLPVASIPEWVQPGVYAILDGATRELVRVQEVGVGSITIDGLLAASWPAGTMLRRGMFGTLDSAFNMRMQTNDLASFSVRFNADPGDKYQDGTGSEGEVFDGREVCLWRPNWSDPVEIGIDAGRETVDYGFGLTADALPLRVPNTTMKATYLARSWEEAKAMKQFFLRQQGQRGEFFMPTWTRDLIPRSNVQGNWLYTDTSADYYAYKDDDLHQTVMVLLKNGNRLYNKVTSVVIDGGSGDTKFLFQDLWGASYSVNEIRLVCWMPLTRFMNDTITIDWQTGEVANFVLTFKQLEYAGQE